MSEYMECKPSNCFMCDQKEKLCYKTYQQGYADGMEKKQSELCEFCDNEKRDARVRADERAKTIDECIEVVKNNYRMDALDKLEQLKEHSDVKNGKAK